MKVDVFVNPMGNETQFLASSQAAKEFFAKRFGYAAVGVNILTSESANLQEAIYEAGLKMYLV